MVLFLWKTLTNTCSMVYSQNSSQNDPAKASLCHSYAQTPPKASCPTQSKAPNSYRGPLDPLQSASFPPLLCDLPSHPPAHPAPVTLTLLLFPEDSVYASHLRALQSILLHYDAFSPHSHRTTSFPSFRTSLTLLFPRKYIFPFPALFSP